MCLKSFKTQRYLKVHQRLYGDAKYQCTRCGKQYALKTSYTNHSKKCQA
jgi:uncharacterized C2H2 Zn-finger protein